MGESAMDKMKGKAKEAVGKVTGDRRAQSEGKTDQAKGGAKDAADQVRERGKGVGDSLKRDDH
ncbi:CsbD family protein [Streptomyces sp. NPDC058374]|uniref:CsbD family protein n=1 Tax=unclassified Streptomyces TaxID=2593676 RepID=UPI003667AF9C